MCIEVGTDLGWEKEYIRMDTQVDQRESHLRGSLNHFYSGFPLANHLSFPGSKFVLGLFQGPPL